MFYRAISWGIILFACFYGLGSYPLSDDNEGLYASAARNMLFDGDWIIPHLNSVAYIEKPPMLYWLMAGSMYLFGVNDWAAHLVPALAFFLTACVMQRFISRQTHNEVAGFTTALIFATTLPTLAMGRMIMCDMVMTLFLSAALMQFYEGYSAASSKHHYRAFWALLALATLSKGFVAFFLAVPTIAIFLYFERATREQIFKLFEQGGIILFLCIAAPWHILATLRQPDFAWFYFINEHVLRFLNKRQPHDYYTGPFWYYVPRLLAYYLPWAFFLLLFTRKKHQPEYPKLSRFLWIWFGFSFLFFSAAGGKANYYMIAAIPALTMLLTLRIQNTVLHHPRLIRSLTTGCLLLIFTIVSFTHYFCYVKNADFFNGCQGVTWPATTSTVIYCIVGMLLSWRLPHKWLPVLLGANTVFLLPLLISGADIADGRFSQKEVANYLNASNYKNIASYEDYEEYGSLAFYLPEPLYIVNNRSNDLLFGMQHTSDASHFINLVNWEQYNPPMPLIVTNKKIPRALDAMQRAGISSDRICITKRFEIVSIFEMCKKP